MRTENEQRGVAEGLSCEKYPQDKVASRPMVESSFVQAKRLGSPGKVGGREDINLGERLSRPMSL